MSKTPLFPLSAAMLACCASAALGQPAADFPDGPGKETVVAVCGGCHAINRMRAGYTPAGWNMLQQHDAEL